VRCYVIEVGSHVSSQPIARGEMLRQRLVNSRADSTKNFVENSLVKGFLVLEVVIKQRLIHPGGTGNRLSAGAGHAFTGELADGRFQDSGTTFLRLPAGAETDCAGNSHI